MLIAARKKLNVLIAREIIGVRIEEFPDEL